MNDVIEIKSDFLNYKTNYESASLCFDSLETILIEIQSLLEDETKWSGESHAVCNQINPLIQKYEQELRLICSDLATNLNGLSKSVEDFVENSEKLTKLKDW